jgi:hypothetical protein
MPTMMRELCVTLYIITHACHQHDVRNMQRITPSVHVVWRGVLSVSCGVAPSS